MTSDRDRTERTERIQRMREGRQSNGGDDASTDATDGPTDDDEMSATDGTSAVETSSDDDTATDDTATDDSSSADDGDGGATATAAGDGATAAVAAAESASAISDAREVFDDDTAADAFEDAADGDVVDAFVEEAVTDDGDGVDEGKDDERGEETAVLEFDLGDERYCLDITYIEQIVERGSITRVPNAPDEVEGVIDLRGSITTVIDPKRALDTDSDREGDLIIVFDADSMEDDWEVGWAVDDVRRVTHVSEADVTPSPVEEPWINGIVRRDEEDGFVIWTAPDRVMQE
ncbi:MAG: chemotaxis protein CheW [Haloferacaceae archaeon]